MFTHTSSVATLEAQPTFFEILLSLSLSLFLIALPSNVPGGTTLVTETILLRDVLREVEHPHGVPHLVVVEGHYLEEVRVQLDAGGGIDGGASHGSDVVCADCGLMADL